MGFYVFFRILSIQIPLVNLTDLNKKFGTRWHTCAKTCAKSTIFQICMYKTKLTETTWIAFITFTSSCCFRLSPCYWLVFELAVLISRYRSGRRYIFGKYLSLNELNLCKLRWIIFVTRHKIRHICDVQCAMEPLKSYRIQHRTQMHSRCTHWDSIRSLSANRRISAASVFMRSWGNFIETENWHFVWQIRALSIL